MLDVNRVGDHASDSYVGRRRGSLGFADRNQPCAVAVLTIESTGIRGERSVQSVNERRAHAVGHGHGGEPAVIMKNVERFALFGHLVDDIQHPRDVIAFVK